MAQDGTNSTKGNAKGNLVVLPVRPKYADFFIPSPGKKKDNELPESVHFVMSGATYRDIEILLTHHKNDFPWRTISDFMRWAAEFGKDFAANQAADARLMTIGAQRRAMHLAMGTAKQNDDFLSDMNKMSEIVNSLIARGHKGPAVELLLKIQGEIKSMEDPYWQEIYKNEFDQRFDQYLHKVSLKKFLEEEEEK